MRRTIIWGCGWEGEGTRVLNGEQSQRKRSRGTRMWGGEEYISSRAAVKGGPRKGKETARRRREERSEENGGLEGCKEDCPEEKIG